MRLQLMRRTRELAFFDLALDSKLRGCGPIAGLLHALRPTPIPEVVAEAGNDVGGGDGARREAGREATGRGSQSAAPRLVHAVRAVPTRQTLTHCSVETGAAINSPHTVRVEVEIPAHLQDELDQLLVELMAGRRPRMEALTSDRQTIEQRATSALAKIVTHIEQHDGTGGARRLVNQ